LHTTKWKKDKSSSLWICHIGDRVWADVPVIGSLKEENSTREEVQSAFVEHQSAWQVSIFFLSLLYPTPLTTQEKGALPLYGRPVQ